ncbi:E3 ubiquitin-protein ligase NEURL3-like [Arapaima gigas]
MSSLEKICSSGIEMLKRSIRRPQEVESPHTCGWYCLGPIAFHEKLKGDSVSLSLEDRRAERLGGSFKDGLVFSSRPVRVRERVRLRVECSAEHWHGALRVGFAAVRPTCRPLPPFAIPDLTSKPGYWAQLVPAVHASLGSELQFWATERGRLMLEVSGGAQICLLEGMDVGGPLWAMIDVYGQTSAVLLLGTVKKSVLWVRKSCPAPPPPPVSPAGSCLCAGRESRCPVKRKLRAESPEPPGAPCSGSSAGWRASGPGEDCVVCWCREACVLLGCGHRCLCRTCAVRVCLELKTCPLCRKTVRHLAALQPPDAWAPDRADVLDAVKLLC